MAIQYFLTDVGRNIALNATSLGLNVSLSHIGVGTAKYDPLTALDSTALVAEVERYPLNGGGVEPNSHTLRFVTSIEPTITVDGFEIGIFTDTGALFAIASTTDNDPLIRLVANIVAISSFGMILSTINLTNLIISVDPNTPICVALMNQHLDHPDPHTQYTLKTDFNNEKADRISSDNLLNNKIDYEITQRTNADSTLQQNINNEQTARINAINQEQNWRTDADNALQGNIDNEQAARIYSDNLLNDKIDYEITQRSNADADLENRKFNKLGGTISGDVDITGEFTAKDFRPNFGNQAFEWNISIGQEALKSANNSTSAKSNIAIGYFSLESNTSSNENIGIGVNALTGLINGDNNIGIGINAGALIYNGYGNIIIGGHLYFQDNINQTVAIGGDAVTGSDQFQLGNSNHTVYCYGSVQNRSDIRDKADIRDTALGLDFINKLRPVDYKWDMREDYREKQIPEFEDEESKNEWIERNKLSNIQHDGTHTRSRYHHGLIAQEVQQIIDETGIDFGGFQDHSINGGEDVLSIGYSELIAPLIKAVQELSSKLKKLEERQS